jgi:hypothetical protein
MRSIKLGFISTAVLLLGACAGQPAQEPATAVLADYDTQASALETSIRAHAAEVASVMDVNALGPMEQAHMGDMSAHLGDMDKDIAMMGTCADAHGAMMDVSPMSTLVQQAATECTRHLDAMTHAADMSAAMAEETAHQATMAAMMQQMMQMADDSMMGGGMMGGGMMGGGMMGGGTYSCPTMNGP